MKKLVNPLVLMAVALLLLTGCGLRPSTSAVQPAEPGLIQPIEGAEGHRLTIGSKNFTEQIILGKMAVLTAEAAGFDAVDMTNIPGSQPARKVLVSGEVDMEWEYTGTAWLTYLGQEESIADSERMWQSVAEADRANGLVWGQPSPLNNTYGMAVRREFAEAHNLTTISDIASLPVEDRTLCIEAEFNSRSDGLNGMLEKYELPRGSGVPEQNVQIMDTGAIYAATDNGTCNFGEIFTTDGRINSLDLVVLEDDRQYFPAYNGAPVFYAQTLEQFPELEDRFNLVAQRLNDDVMRDLNYRVDVQGEDPGTVARDWMLQEGLITE